MIYDNEAQYVEDLEFDKGRVNKAWGDWIADVAEWKYFVTLTFREEDTSEEKAEREFIKWIRNINKAEFGNNYTRKVGHSYFSYIVGMEYQIRGTPHFHVLIDKPINCTAALSFWKHNGFAQISFIRKYDESIKYVIKYAIKAEKINVFVTDSGIDIID